VTDGFEFYERVVRRVFGPACLYGQVSRHGGTIAWSEWSEEPGSGPPGDGNRRGVTPRTP
jgi:hypothetical protein